jgi:DNA modification methylase
MSFPELLSAPERKFPPPVRVRRRQRVAAEDSTLNQAIAYFAPQIVQLPLSELKPSARNARTHKQEQIHLIAASIGEFGFITPIVIDRAGEIVAGQGRYEAAKLLGLSEVPTVRLDHLSADQIRAYRIADNRLAELAGWDEELLQLELGHLIEINFDVEVTGFSTPQIDSIFSFGEPKTKKADPADDMPSVATMAVSQLGDLWLLGEHRILCGDARDPEAYAELLGDERAQAVFTDPPYNVKIDGHVSGHGRIKHRAFPMACGEMSKAEFTAFLQTVFERIASVCEDGALIYGCIDGRHLHETLNAGFAVFDQLKTVLTWAKTCAGLGSLYRSQTELITLWKKGKAAHINNIELGRHGRYRTTLWTYAGVNGFRKGRMEELESHPTVKPCAMVMDAIKDCSKPKGIILDPFGGSGTTLIAAAKTKRRGFVLELDPLYVDVAVRRWEKLFKAEARHAETGLTFSETAAIRGEIVQASATQQVGGGNVA